MGNLNELLSFQWDRIQALFFDFDGVLVDSVNLKTEAYQDIFRPLGDKAVQIITEYHLKFGGVDRYRKIQHTLNELKQDTGDDCVKKLAQQFASLVKEKVIKAPMLPGMLDLLEEARARHKPCFVVSGTPQVELQEIVQRRELEVFFKAIYGSPDTKIEILNRELSLHGFNPGRCLFFGDASTDFEAAMHCDLFFIGIPPA